MLTMAVAREEMLLMSMTEIAELADVRRPVVSTWRRRYPDFPQPATEERGQQLFEATRIVDWLVKTGRAEQGEIEGDLRVHTLARLGAQLAPRTLIPALTALICLRHLSGDEPLDDETSGLMARLREQADDTDPDDELLASEIRGLRAPWLPAAVDELVEAAWSPQGAFERIMQVRDRLGAAGLSSGRLDLVLESLVAGLADARARADREGEVRLVDPSAGVGDLLVAVAGTLRDDQVLRVTACCADPVSARLTRRRLAVRDVPEVEYEARTDPDGCLDEATIVVTQLPYRPAEERSAVLSLNALNDLLLPLPPGATAVVVAPADTTAALDPTSDAGVLRGQLLASGSIKAVIRLPGGLVPYRPGYELALWVLTADYAVGERGKVLLADVSDRALTPGLVDALVTDVLAWRDEQFDPEARRRIHTVATPVSALIASPRPMLPRYLPSQDDLRWDVPERVARALELERMVWEARPDAPRLNSDLSAVPRPRPPRTATIAELSGRGRAKALSLRKGTRLPAGLIRPASSTVNATNSHPVFGPPEVLGESEPGSRRVDRFEFERTCPGARHSKPGDVIITTVPRPSAAVDHDGHSVVEFPARILRIEEDGKKHFTPRVLAALLDRAGRADGAIRPAQRLQELALPLLSPSEVKRLDRLLADLDDRRDRAHREIAALDELRRIAATGLADGTLTLTDPNA
ncbi:hypothetical protein BKA00_005797 [Actinomadura coerulea]|uniref:DNA methylase adenine-specific domain-containing protein n=1 Tax=Actinomadura coerulea TaxID=46159 RepID=A0A7X0L1S3_9ACTN|nr:hypothetical protein [Actinomadura coerulea]MBB6398883.1 hypothetical protein [Actinomadura coerulea]